MEISILFKTYFRTNSTSVLMIQRAGAAQTPCRKAHCTSGSDLPFFESRFPICSRGEPVTAVATGSPGLLSQSAGLTGYRYKHGA